MLRVAVTVEQSKPAEGDGYGYGSRLVREIPDPALPSAVVLHDSFVPSELEPLLSEHFRRVVYLWLNDFDIWTIARERPDLVIEEKVERYFSTSRPSNPRELGGAPPGRPRPAAGR